VISMSKQDKMITVLEKIAEEISRIESTLSSIENILRLQSDNLSYWLTQIDSSLRNLKET